MTKMNSKGPEMLRPHAVCIPALVQSHIKATLQFAKLLHHKGFYITFVITESCSRRMLNAGGPDSLQGLPDFRFEIIPDGIPVSDPNVNQAISSVLGSIRDNLLQPFIDVLSKLTDTSSLPCDIPSVSCIIADGFMPFTLEAAEKFGLPVVAFFTVSASSLMGCKQFRALKDKGLVPFKDDSCSMKRHVDTILDWIPGMKDIRLRDLPVKSLGDSFNMDLFDFTMEVAESASRASAIVVHTFDELERDVLEALSSIYPLIYAIGPIPLLLGRTLENIKYNFLGCNFWKEETECLQWLNSKENDSVLYVNFGSLAELRTEQLIEFASGLANSNHNILWIIRPDLIMANKAILPPEFIEGTNERCMISGWCPQEEVLKHPSVKGFLTHCGWNSTIESMSAGVPLICWPNFGDQQTNCRYSCNEWGIGLEMDEEVRKEEVEKLVREFMEGEKGRKVKQNVMEWKKKAEEAVSEGGSSIISFNNLVNKISLATSNVFSEN